jgi:hypothetical protein
LGIERFVVIERVERNNDLTRAEPVREVRQTKESTAGKPNKKFIAEIEKKISEEKGKKKQKKEKDEIILHDELDENELPPEKDNSDHDDKLHKKSKTPPPSPDDRRGKKIDVLA